MKKFLGTYVLSIVLIISIAIVIDITEKMDDFYNEGLDFKTIVMEYYIYFVPYYTNLFSSLFTFLAVIFVTSKLAFNSEIIAMLAGGISFRRILVPYLISAAIIAGATFYISSEIIPPGIRERLKFEYKYVEHKKFESSLDHQQLRISENEIIYVERYDITRNIGYKFSYDRFDGKKLEERITAMRIQHDSLYNWTAYNCMQRMFVGLKEEVTTHDEMKLELNMIPKDFVKVVKEYEQLTTSELVEYLETQSKRGLYGLNAYELELQKRIASPFSAFVLTIIGVSVASRKSRGGTGFHIFIGFLLSVTYILFNMVSSSLTIKGGLNPTISVWLPNVLYLAIGIYLYKIAPK
ncbi:MAG: LptF/LptG family permease [Paludibacteraceae bacterium]|nr:LptF/LptG family permease [Paludibacteraceae bacterium]